MSLTVPGGTAAGNYPIQAAYVPTGNFAANSDNSKQLAIAKTTPVITWANPPDIQPGTALSSTQLNATASVPGTFTYNPPTGTVLPIGSGQALSVTFTPTDSTDYNTAVASAQINVKQTTLTMTVTKVTTGSKLTYSSNPQPVVLSALVTSPSGAVKGGSVTFTVGTLFFAGILNAVTTGSAPVINGSATASLTMPGAPAVGFYTVEAVYNPDPTGNFGASGDRQFALEIQAKITWPTPADITFGTALSSDQLNATASFPGSLTYTPTTGTVLPVGRQLLSVHFVS